MIAFVLAAVLAFSAPSGPTVSVHRLGGEPYCGVLVKGAGFSHGLVTIQIIATLPGKTAAQVISSAATRVNAVGRWSAVFRPPLSTGFAVRSSGGTFLQVTYVDSTCTPP